MECYSVTVNSSGTKLALGGLDGMVRIWDVASILRYRDHATLDDAQSRNLLDRLNLHKLATLLRPLTSVSRHNGVVSSVKFLQDGRFLASGSDDKIVLIWEKDDDLANRPKQFGETEPDMEHWTVRKRLVAHDNDVQDLCWSPDGALLITVGLDRSIIIWSGTTFERIKRYDIHQSMVKGVVFDPANKFFATASDDRTVRVFRYYRKHDAQDNYEFQMEQIVFEPFLKLPLTSYYRRMSWSPDGQHIAVPNATNGPVTSVAIVSRGIWATDVSLIGHEAPCEVCAFSPRLFRLHGSQEHTTILASAGQDRTLAVWSTALLKPLVVLQDIALRSITDICWTPCGQNLFLSSLDGLITCVTFDEHELGELVGDDAITTQLLRYGGNKDSKIIPEGVSQLRLEQLAKTLEKPPRDEPSACRIGAPTRPGGAPAHFVQLSDPAQSPAPGLHLARKTDKVTLHTATVKGGRKRVAPTLVSKYTQQQETASKVVRVKSFDISLKLSQTRYVIPRPGVQTAVHGLALRLARAETHRTVEDVDNDNDDINIDDTGAQLASSAPACGNHTKLKNYRKHIMRRKYPTPFRFVSNLPDVFFSQHALMSHELALLVLNKQLGVHKLVNTAPLDSLDEKIYFQVVSCCVEHVPVTESSDERIPVTSTVEVRNGPAWPDNDEVASTDFAQRRDFVDPTQVSVVNRAGDTSRSYMLYFPFRVQQLIPVVREQTLSHYVFVSFDGTVQIVRAGTGMYACPAFELGSNVVAWRQRNRHLLLLTGSGLVYIWRLCTQGINGDLTRVVCGVSVAAVLNAETAITLDRAKERAKGDAGKNSIQDTGKNSDDKEKESKRELNPVRRAIVDDLRSIDVDELGVPYVMVERTCAVYAYSVDLQVWTKVVDPWLFSGLEPQNCLGGLAQRSYDAYTEKIDRGEIRRCVFDDTTRDLLQCVSLRLREQLQMT